MAAAAKAGSPTLNGLGFGGGSRDTSGAAHESALAQLFLTAVAPAKALQHKPKKPDTGVSASREWRLKKTGAAALKIKAGRRVAGSNQRRAGRVHR